MCHANALTDPDPPSDTKTLDSGIHFFVRVWRHDTENVSGALSSRESGGRQWSRNDIKTPAFEPRRERHHIFSEILLHISLCPILQRQLVFNLFRSQLTLRHFMARRALVTSSHCAHHLQTTAPRRGTNKVQS